MEPPGSLRWPLWPWYVLLVVALVDGAWLAAGPVSLDIRSVYTIIMLCLVGAGLTAAATHPTVSPQAAAFASGLAFILVAWPVLRLLNYSLMSVSFPHRGC